MAITRLHLNSRTSTGVTLLRCAPVLLICLAVHFAQAQTPQPRPAKAPDTNTETMLYLGGVGGVYLLAEPGELVVEIEKRDLNNRGARTDLRAILAGPDRRVLQDITIPDDGQAKGSGKGPVQRCRLSTQVPAKGVYVVNITVSQDRYGEQMVWGFKANCPKYIIETARGHKDERHQEPIVLASPDRETDVWFLPRREAFDIEVTGVRKSASPLQVFSSDGKLMASLEVSSEGKASHRFPADRARKATPWRLHLPSAQATVHIDGVTRWERGDAYPDMACWTPDLNSWFPLLENRWLLTPYSRTVFAGDNKGREVTFRVHNNSGATRTIDLALELPGNAGKLDLSDNQVKLEPGKSKTVTVKCTMPKFGSTYSVRLRATPKDGSGFSTYSTIVVKPGHSPASKPIALPLQLKPYEHENEQFGHLPEYPVENQVYFDTHNRPFVRNSSGVEFLRDGRWSSSGEKTGQYRPVSSKIAFDSDNHIYLLGADEQTTALLHSSDGGRTFVGVPIPEGKRRSSYDIEQFSGRNNPSGPPPILRYTLTAADPKLIWRRVNDLELIVPRKEQGRIVFDQPVLVSSNCIGLAAHSGIPSTVVSRDSKIHMVWGEASDPQQKVPGVPTYVATYDAASRKLSKPALVAHGPPANDVHNTPSITMDSKGYLHVLAGTHGRPFPYAQSLQPNTAAGGWTEPVVTGENLNQTYIGLVCGPDDTLHAVFRLWRSGGPFPSSTYATLAYQRKRPGQPWESPRILVAAPFSEYSVFYHRLTIDREGRLFLNYDYWSTFWFYRNDHSGSRRALLMSPDAGETWKLAQAEGFK